MNRALRNTGWGICLLLGTHSLQSLTAELSTGRAHALLQNLPRPLAEAELNEQRGGFLTAEGFNVRIGFERVTLIDGVVVARSTLTLPDMNNRMQAMDQQMQAMSQDMEAMKNTMQENMATSMNAMESALSNPQVQNHPGLDARGQQALATTAQALQANPAVDTSGSGFDLQVDSNAQAGVKRDTATLSLVDATQVQSASSLTPARALSADAGQAVSMALNTPVHVSQSMTNIAQTATTTLIQNAADNRMIQTLETLNIELSGLGPRGVPGLGRHMLPSLQYYSR
ncbi:hypothetical protein [Pseudomaricurvus sp. HS19]|uniref:hypothetical protein n=1 Tax=Pseudomaricurvus sp. HS19 TaxID=2692626 RepID=UPI00136EABBD|nr:hypothetical protein [Pseudomaricurvus sp. HS19]MYM63404.1 hypothetical protein [Pseudomaricurvus sp. HS19]